MTIVGLSLLGIILEEIEVGVILENFLQKWCSSIGCSFPCEPNNNQSDESPEDCQGAQTSKDGKGNKITVGHSDAGSTTSIEINFIF